MAVRPSIDVQMQFSGSAGAWTSVRTDLRTPLRVEYGIQGTGPNDRVAGTGTLAFALNNGQNNSAKLIGYYAPGHTNARSGFELGIGVRLAITYSGSTFYKFRGVLDAIDPMPGQYRDRITYCTAVDWMDEAARHKLKGIPIQLFQRADQLIDDVVTNMSKRPAASSLSVAQTEYPFALDTAKDENTTALAEFQRIANRDLGYIFLRGDTSTGGVLTFHDRRRRMNPGSASTTLSNNMVEMQARRGRALVGNRIRTIIHPRRVDTTTSTVLFSLEQQAKPSVQTGCSITLIGNYTDPALRAQRVGGASMVDPVSGTDYTFGSDEFDTSYTASLTVTASYGANTVFYTLTNAGSVTGVVSKLQARGAGIYDYGELAIEATSGCSAAAYGENLVAFDMPYEYQQHAGKGIADYELFNRKDPRYAIEQLTFVANENASLMEAALRREPGDLVQVTEAATGISASQFFIQGVTLDGGIPDILSCAWTVMARTDPTDYWMLDVDKLGVTAADSGSQYAVLGI